MRKEDVGRFCKECKEGYRSCHDECFAYKVEKARWALFKKKYQTENDWEALHAEYMNEKMIRRHR